MRFSSLIVLPFVTSLVAGADQIPLKDRASEWINKAKGYIPDVSPVDSGAAYVADQKVERINIRNWERKLSPKLDTEEEWLVYITGGNKSCFGRCAAVDQTWNKSVALLSAIPKSKTAPLHLGLLDCEKDTVLCTAWAATLPAIYHFNVPKQTEPQTPVPLHIVPLNISTTTTDDIVSIPNVSKARYLQYTEYQGAMHPFDGWMAKFHVHIPFGYAMWAFGSTPSWLMMIVISFFSRQIMSRRMADRPGIPVDTGARPAAAPQAQTPVKPAGGAPKSGGKKRK